MTTWDSFFTGKLEELAQEKLIIDIGGGEPLQKNLSSKKDLFSQSKFFTVDITSDFNPSVVADAHHIPIKSNTAKAVLCNAVLEHVQNPLQVVAELYRIGKKGSKYLIYVPFLYPYHGNQEYKDYFRFSHDALEYLFRKWTSVELQAVRGYAETIINLLPSSLAPFLTPIAKLIDSTRKTPQVSGYYLYAVK